MRQELDLFETSERLPPVVKEIVDRYGKMFANGDDDPYKLCTGFLSELKPFGYTFDWGLDGEPHNLRDELEFLSGN